MNRAYEILHLMRIDLGLIEKAQNDVNEMTNLLEDELKKAEEKCELYEEMYEDDTNLVMSAYEEYEEIRSPLTFYESILNDFKVILIEHYEQLLIEKDVYDVETSMILSKSKYNLVKMNETVEIIKGVLA